VGDRRTDPPANDLRSKRRKLLPEPATGSVVPGFVALATCLAVVQVTKYW
jgi:hypothetical protein